MKSLICSLFLALTCTLHAADDLWLTNFETAKTKAATDKKNLLLYFTGSDWCGYCIQLDKEVFQKAEFPEAVKDKLVLVKIDFPEDESKITKETLDQNEKLQESYQVDGYPTLILTDASGKPFAITGYQEGGAAKYITHLNTLLAQKAAFDSMIGDAGKLDGLAKAEKLGQALQSIELPDRLLMSFHEEITGTIESLDPDTTLPFHKELKTTKRFLALEKAVEALIEGEKPGDALVLVDKSVADGSFTPEQRQRMMFFKAVVLMESEKFDQALGALEACRQIAPDSEFAATLDVLKNHIESLRDENNAPQEPAPQPEPADKVPQQQEEP